MNNNRGRWTSFSISPCGTQAGFLPGLRYLGFAFLLLFAGNASAVITVTLSLDNTPNAIGNFVLVKGEKVIVRYSVDEDTDNDLNKKDKIQLMRVSDDKVLASVERGKKKSGTVKIPVNKIGEKMYVRYVRKGNAGTEIDRYAHPADGDPSLESIAKLGGNDVSTAVHGLNTGAVSVSAAGFQSEINVQF